MTSPHPTPERVDAALMEMQTRARQQVAAARDAWQRAEGALALLNGEIVTRHQLRDGDSVQDDGTIVRAAATEVPAEPSP